MDDDSGVTRRGLIAGADALIAAAVLARPTKAAASNAATRPSFFLPVLTAIRALTERLASWITCACSMVTSASR